MPAFCDQSKEIKIKLFSHHTISTPNSIFLYFFPVEPTYYLGVYVFFCTYTCIYINNMCVYTHIHSVSLIRIYPP